MTFAIEAETAAGYRPAVFFLMRFRIYLGVLWLGDQQADCRPLHSALLGVGENTWSRFVKRDGATMQLKVRFPRGYRYRQDSGHQRGAVLARILKKLQ